MKYLLAFLFVAAIPAWAEDQVAVIKQQADLLSAAAIKGDAAEVIRYTNPRMTKVSGGEETMVKTLTAAFEGMKAQGIKIESSTNGQPQPPQKIGDWLVSLVPLEIVLKSADKRIRVSTQLVGVSEDGGKNWAFVDASALTHEEFFEVFPELKDKITLPDKKEPVIEPLS